MALRAKIVESKIGAGTTAGALLRDTESWKVGAGGAALEMLGKAKATPTIAVVRISFSFMVAPLGPSPWWSVIYHSERAGSRERTFSSDIAYSDSPAVSASARRSQPARGARSPSTLRRLQRSSATARRSS